MSMPKPPTHLLTRPFKQETSDINKTTKVILPPPKNSSLFPKSKLTRKLETSIILKPLGRSIRNEQVSLSAFAFLFSELIQYHQAKVDKASNLETLLEGTGYGIGFKILEFLCYKSREYKRHTTIVQILSFISNNVWKYLFQKPLDSLEKSIESSNEYMLTDYDPIVSRHVSSHGSLSVDSFVSGIISGILQGAGFPSVVTAHNVKLEEGENNVSSNKKKSDVDEECYTGSYGMPRKNEKVVFLVKFEPQVMLRETWIT